MSNENKIYEDKINTIESEQTSNEKGESLINIKNKFSFFFIKWSSIIYILE